MLLEVLAPRILQPYFGASTFVWTNVIGVILLAMALGYDLGGRIAARGAGIRRIATTLFGAAGWAVAVIFAFGPVAELLLPGAEALARSDDARSQLEQGSLVAALILFCPPVFFLATLTPQLVHQLTRGGYAAGRASGRIFMLGTIGSLVGTFLPTYWLVPAFGTRASLCVAASLLVIPGIALLMGRVGRAASAALVIAACVLGFAATICLDDVLRPALAGETLLAERESRYQYLRVVERPAVENAEVLERALCIDEGVLEFHSVDTLGRTGTLGKYYDYLALTSTLFGAGRRLRVLVLGSGMGTLSRMMVEFWPDRFEKIVDVEIDPEVVALARKNGFPEHPSIETVTLDARAYLHATDETFDLILVDAYARQVDIPFHMATVEFFADVREHLVEDGVVALNVSCREPGAALVQALGRSLEGGGFGEVTTVWVRHWGNRMVWSSRRAERASFARVPVPEELVGILDHVLRAQMPLAVSADVAVLTDDHAPVESLTRRSLTGAR